jgi:murein DD-endopeptidase MepM/ murein hydrolase activator NlpD
MKKKIFAILALVLLFIPTYAAIAYYKIAQNAPVEVKAVNKMTLTDLIGDTFEFEKTDKKLKDNIEENMLAFFMDMNAKATPQATIPEGIDINTYFKANIFSYDRESIYRYYFSDGADNSWFIDGDGNIFQISSNHAKKFLDSIYARSLYPDSVVPEMIMDDQLIEPRMMKWEYRSQSNSFITAADIDNTTAEMKTYLLVGGRMNITFGVEPDAVNVKIVSGGSTVFDDTYENVGNLNLKENDDAAITVTAKWYETSDRNYRGEATYNFNSKVTAEPLFYLGESSVLPGDFVTVTGFNVTEVANVKFSSTPDIGFTPVFFRDGTCVRALIPVDVNIPEIAAMSDNDIPDENVAIDMTFTTAGVSTTLTLVVNEKTFKSQTLDFSAQLINSTYSEAAIEEYKNSLSDALNNKEPNRYWEGTFIEASPEGIIRTGFGLYRTITATGQTVRHTGVDYIAAPGSSVLAVAGGKVIYTGELTTSGKIVVVEHGWGLKSTYEHLSTISVAVGDVVNKGDTVGLVGNTGCTEGYMLHTALFVFKVPVCPYPLWEKGIPMKEVSAVGAVSEANVSDSASEQSDSDSVNAG